MILNAASVWHWLAHRLALRFLRTRYSPPVEPRVGRGQPHFDAIRLRPSDGLRSRPPCDGPFELTRTGNSRHEFSYSG